MNGAGLEDFREGYGRCIFGSKDNRKVEATQVVASECSKQEKSKVEGAESSQSASKSKR